MASDCMKKEINKQMWSFKLQKKKTLNACSNNIVIGSDFSDCMRSSQIIYVPRLVCDRKINNIFAFFFKHVF